MKIIAHNNFLTTVTFIQLFWLTVVLADKLEYLYAARVLAGIAGGYDKKLRLTRKFAKFK